MSRLEACQRGDGGEPRLAGGDVFLTRGSMVAPSLSPRFSASTARATTPTIRGRKFTTPCPYQGRLLSRGAMRNPISPLPHLQQVPRQVSLGHRERRPARPDPDGLGGNGLGPDDGAASGASRAVSGRGGDGQAGRAMGGRRGGGAVRERGENYPVAFSHLLIPSSRETRGRRLSFSTYHQLSPLDRLKLGEHGGWRVWGVACAWSVECEARPRKGRMNERVRVLSSTTRRLISVFSSGALSVSLRLSLFVCARAHVFFAIRSPPATSDGALSPKRRRTRAWRGVKPLRAEKRERGARAQIPFPSALVAPVVLSQKKSPLPCSV